MTGFRVSPSSSATADHASSGAEGDSAPPGLQALETAASPLSPRGSGSREARSTALPPRTPLASGTLRHMPPQETPLRDGPVEAVRSIGAVPPASDLGSGGPSIKQEVEQWEVQVAAEPVPPISYSLLNYLAYTTPPTPEEFVSRAAQAIVQAAASGARHLTIDTLPATSLPSAIGRLAHLKMLWIRDTECTTLPDSIGGLVGLQDLSLHNNPRLNRLPDRMVELRQLKSLSVTDTPLESWPEGIGALSKLNSLRLSGGTYQQLPSCLVGLTALKDLHIGAHAHMQELPAGMGRLERLARLHIEYCPKLRSLPSLGSQSALKVLDLLRCEELETLPSDLGDLRHLHTLRLIGCTALKDLPESLSRLPEHCTIVVPPRLQERLAEILSSRHRHRPAEPAAAERP